MNTNEKTCFKCGVNRPITEFYVHPQMGDGRLNKCKSCTKADVAANYRDNFEHYQKYEKARFKTARRKSTVREAVRRRKERNPEKEFARQAVGNAVRDGKLIRLPCEVCGNPKSEGHHEDYSKQLSVRWLCRKHHRMAHGQLRHLKTA